MRVTTYLIIIFGFHQKLFSQQIPVSTVLHRVKNIKVDTMYDFFAIRPEKKIHTSPGKRYFWYEPDTILCTQGFFSGRLLDGQYKEFYKNKNLKVKGQYKWGLENGEWMAWYPNGQLKKIEHWKDGLKNGAFVNYNERGVKIEVDMYRYDQPDGIQLMQNGSLNSYDTL